MMLLTGATGFIGSAVLQRLVKQPNLVVRTYGRSVPNRLINCTENITAHVVGEISANADYSIALNSIDVIIHCAAKAHVMNNAEHSSIDMYRSINVDGVINLARQAISAGVKRFVFISSVKVNGESTLPGQQFNCTNSPAPVDDYGRSKRDAEDALRQLLINSSMELVIIRPPLVYGLGVKGNFSSLLGIVKRNIPLPLGAINNKRSMVSLDNLVDLIITCIDHPKAANQIFLVSDDHDVSTSELLDMMARSAGKSSRLLPVPMSWLRLMGKLTGKQAVIERLCGNLQVDITHTKDVLGWQPPISVEEGVKRCFVEDKK